MSEQSVKVTVIGGSAVGTPEFVEAIKRHSHAPGERQIEIVLYARNAGRLDAVTRVAKNMAQGCDWLHVSGTTDLAQALDGAGYVINQMRIGGLAARAFDETFPIRFGIPGEETIGPGGFANAMRTVPEAVRIAKQIERYAPGAMLLSFTNPASVIQYAVTRTTRVNVIGLCDGPVTMTTNAADALGMDKSALKVDYVGMHHFGFITRVVHADTDMTAQMLDALTSAHVAGIDLGWVRSLQALPSAYFRYFLQPEEALAKQKAQRESRAEQLMQIEADLLAEYETAQGRPQGLSARGAKWYDAIIAPVLMALIEQQSGSFIMNVKNGGALGWLPEDAIIETPCAVTAGEVRPLFADTRNKEIRARVDLNCAYEQLMVESFLEGSYAKALRALTMNPLVPSLTRARQMLDTLWPDAAPKNL